MNLVLAAALTGCGVTCGDDSRDIVMIIPTVLGLGVVGSTHSFGNPPDWLTVGKPIVDSVAQRVIIDAACPVVAVKP